MGRVLSPGFGSKLREGRLAVVMGILLGGQGDTDRPETRRPGGVEHSFASARSGGGSGWDLSLDAAALPDDSVIITGHFKGSATLGAGEINETVLVADGSEDTFVARRDRDCRLVRARKAGEAKVHTDPLSIADSGRGVAALPNDFVIVVGFFEEIATFGLGEPNESSPVPERG